ncbi:MAG: PAS domain S-box protein [Sideroxyarcus sp.]|nr:PAS domain S-box protein [Sideroxyarcus sp.]
MTATILIIDDNEIDRHLYQRAFRDFATYYKLVMAPSAQAGLDLLAGANPDLILLDYYLPDVDGLSLMKRLLEISGGSIPVVVLIGANSTAVAVEAMKQGADDYLVKDTLGRYLIMLPGVVGRVMTTHTKSEQAKRLQQHTEALLHRNLALMKSSTDGIHIMDAEGNLLEANDAFYRMLGYAQDAAPSLNVADWNTQWSRDELREIFRSRIGKSAMFETRHRRQDGTEIDVEVSTAGVEIAGENLFFAASRDITARKRAETVLRQHKLVIETSIDGFWSTDLNGYLQEANAAYAQMSGYTVDELVNMHISQLEANEQPAVVQAHIARVIAQGYDRFETRHRCKDGHEIDIEISTTCMAEPQRLFVFCRDITERKRAEVEMQHNQNLLNAAQRLAKLGSWELDLPSGRVHWSDEMFRIFELDPARFTPTYESFLDRVHPQDRDRVNRAFTLSLQEKLPYDVEHRLLFSDGRIKWVREHCSTTFSVSGKPLRSSGMSQDITEHKLAEQKLLLENEAEHRRAEMLARQFGQLLQNSFNEIYLFDAATLRFLQASEGATKNLGYSVEELEQLTPQELNPSHTRERLESLVAPLRNGERQSLLFETELHRKDGTTYPIEVRLQLMQADSAVFLAVAQDITERKQVETQRRELTAYLQAVREEEKASFAREIHDELGSTLTALKLDASWLAQMLPAGTEMQSVRECAKSMISLLDGAVLATRRIISSLRPAILDDIGLLAAMKWQARQFQQRTGIECRILCNCSEARDCEEILDSTISINLFRIFQESLSNVARHSGATRVDIEFSSHTGEVALSIKDNGRGLPEGHVLAPTSFGLRGMRERVTQLGGKIKFEYSPGFGVVVKLPLQAERKERTLA